MAVRAKKSGLGSILKKRGKDKTVYDTSAGLPPGIKNGIASLAEGAIGKYKSGVNKGKLYLRLAGTVLSPSSVTFSPKFWDPEEGKTGGVVTGKPETVQVKGLRTQIMLALCATGKGDKAKTEEDNVAKALNELRKIGGEDCTEDLSSEQDLVDLIESLVEDGVNFKFNTSASTPNEAYPDATVWENWNGSKGVDQELEGDEDEDDDELEDETDDDDDETEEDDGEEDDDGEGDDDEPEEDDGDGEDEDEEAPFGDSDELEELADKAEEDDEEAQEALVEKATEAGVDEGVINDEDTTWHQLANSIREIESSEEEDDDDEEEEEEELVPEKGEVYSFRPPRAKKDVEVEVVSVVKSKKICKLKTDAGKIYSNIPWSKLKE